MYGLPMLDWECTRVSKPATAPKRSRQGPCNACAKCSWHFGKERTWSGSAEFDKLGERGVRAMDKGIGRFILQRKKNDGAPPHPGTF